MPHPWPVILPAIRFGPPGGDRVRSVQVEPTVVVEVEVDTAYEHAYGGTGAVPVAPVRAATMGRGTRLRVTRCSCAEDGADQVTELVVGDLGDVARPEVVRATPDEKFKVASGEASGVVVRGWAGRSSSGCGLAGLVRRSGHQVRRCQMASAAQWATIPPNRSPPVP